VEKYGRAGQATDDNMPHALCMLDKLQTRSISTATMVATMRLVVTFHVHCMSCYVLNLCCDVLLSEVTAKQIR